MSKTLSEDDTLRAAEYVLGTLEGAERRQLEKELPYNYALRQELHRWEAHLVPMAEALPPLSPEPAVWDQLLTRISADRVVALKQRQNWTAGWAAVATAASMALAAVLVLRPPPEPVIQLVERTVEVPVEVQVPKVEAAYVAYLKMPDADMHWTVTLHPDGQAMRVRAGGTPPDAAAAFDTELWWLGPDGPVSMGVIPKRGESGAAIPTQIATLDGKQLAVSLEPRGGSPSGSPTGPVIAVGEVVRAI